MDTSVTFDRPAGHARRLDVSTSTILGLLLLLILL